MMKSGFCALAVLLALFSAPDGAAWAQGAAPRTLSMGGHGEVRAAPDQATLNAGVTVRAPTAAAALADNAVRMNAVFAALRSLGVPQGNIQTSGFSVSPQYTNGGGNAEPQRLTGYQVNNEVSVRLEDVTRVGAALDALVTAGANQMNGVSFAIRDPAPLLEKARAAAVADARNRAETYARAAGVTLGPILSISEGAEGPRPLYRVAAMAGATPIAVGEQSVSADVTLVWEIR